MLGPVVDRAGIAGALNWRDGFKCQTSGDRLTCYDPHMGTSAFELRAGEPLPPPISVASWGPGRALLFGVSAATFLFDRTARTLRKLDDRSFHPAFAPDGAIYGVLTARAPSQQTAVVRLDERGFVAITVPRPAWLSTTAYIDTVSAGAAQLAVRFTRGTPPFATALVLVDRPR